MVDTKTLISALNAHKDFKALKDEIADLDIAFSYDTRAIISHFLTKRDLASSNDVYECVIYILYELFLLCVSKIFYNKFKTAPVCVIHSSKAEFEIYTKSLKYLGDRIEIEFSIGERSFVLNIKDKPINELIIDNTNNFSLLNLQIDSSFEEYFVSRRNDSAIEKTFKDITISECLTKSFIFNFLNQFGDICEF